MLTSLPSFRMHTNPFDWMKINKHLEWTAPYLLFKTHVFLFSSTHNLETNTHGRLLAKYKQIDLILHVNDHENGMSQNFTIVPFFMNFYIFL